MSTPLFDSEVEKIDAANKDSENPILAKRRRLGFFMVGIGAFLCIFGFLITLFLLQHEANFSLALYGATGLGGTLLFGGLVAIVG